MCFVCLLFQYGNKRGGGGGGGGDMSNGFSSEPISAGIPAGGDDDWD